MIVVCSSSAYSINSISQSGILVTSTTAIASVHLSSKHPPEQQSALDEQAAVAARQQFPLAHTDAVSQSLSSSQPSPGPNGSHTPLLHLPEQQSPSLEQFVLFGLQQASFWQAPEQQSLFAVQVALASMQQTPFEHVAPATQSADSSHVPPLETKSPTHIQLTQIPEQQSLFAVQEALVAVQQIPFEHVAPATQSADSSHVPPSATRPASQISLTQTSEQQSMLDEHVASSGYRQVGEPDTVQSIVPAGHEHTPSIHVSGDVQLVPHAPQLLPSVCKFAHVPEQLLSKGSGHRHTPPLHVCGEVQIVPQVPQLRPFVCRLVHEPEQQLSPDPHT